MNTVKILLDSGIQLSDSVIHMYAFIAIFLFRFFPITVLYKILNIVPCGIP